jgi:hypothetical protein
MTTPAELPPRLAFVRAGADSDDNLAYAVLTPFIPAGDVGKTWTETLYSALCYSGYLPDDGTLHVVSASRAFVMYTYNCYMAINEWRARDDGVVDRFRARPGNYISMIPTDEAFAKGTVHKDRCSEQDLRDVASLLRMGDDVAREESK